MSLWPSLADPIQLQVLVVARGNAALAMSKLARVGKKAPEGWDIIYDTLEMFDNRMKDAVNENHEGKRKNESNWFVPRRDGKACVQACVQACVPAHRRGRTHRQTRDRQAGRQAGARVCCALPLFTRAGRPYQPRLTRGGRPIHRINYERTRYVYELHYKTKEISRELLDFCIREKVRECLPRARKRCDVAHLSLIHI